MARSLSRELLPRGIRVNTVSPGPIGHGDLGDHDECGGRRAVQGRTSCGQSNASFGTTDEVARAAAFLAFDATYTTGAELAVDGGASQLWPE